MAESVVIDSLGHAGDGVAVISSGPIYVPFTLPGERVEINSTKGASHAVPLNILQPSPDRVSPICRHFAVCGGCALQHMALPAYLEWKRDNVRHVFAQHGIDAPIAPVVPVPVGSRRRAAFSAIQTSSGLKFGFFRRGSREIVDIAECPVLDPGITENIGLLRSIAALLARSAKPLRITVTATDSGLDIALDSTAPIDRQRSERLAVLAAAPCIARIAANGQDLIIKRPPEIRRDGTRITPVPGGFLQATAEAEAAILEIISAHIGKANPVLELFAGIGTFTLPLARKASVTAVEGDEKLLAAIQNARRGIMGLKPITTRKRDLFLNPMAPKELNGFRSIIFDPPAAGAKAQAERIAQSAVTRVVAVSCNPATLARDSRILVDGGYRIERVVPIDQFLFSSEIEVVATFLK